MLERKRKKGNLRQEDVTTISTSVETFVSPYPDSRRAVSCLWLTNNVMKTVLKITMCLYFTAAMTFETSSPNFSTRLLANLPATLLRSISLKSDLEYKTDLAKCYSRQVYLWIAIFLSLFSNRRTQNLWRIQCSARNARPHPLQVHLVSLLIEIFAVSSYVRYCKPDRHVSLFFKHFQSTNVTGLDQFS